MDSRVALQPAYVLHSQPFQNTSLLVDFFTMDYGPCARGRQGRTQR